MKDFEKIIAQRGIAIGLEGHWTEEKFISDDQRWKSFLYVYSEVYAKNDRLLWKVDDESINCRPVIIEEQGFIYLFYREYDGTMSPIAFTHKDFTTIETSCLETMSAWWC